MANDVEAKHPLWDGMEATWVLMRDCAAGEAAVKDKATTYLPFPSGFRNQPDGGTEMYSGYQVRARYPDIVLPTLQGMVGVIHRTEAQIEGLEEGKPLASLWEKATKDGLTLETFHRRITYELLLMGRFAILTDVPSAPGETKDAMPYFAGFGAERLINWSDLERDLYVLDESGKTRKPDSFSWDDIKSYRVLRLKDKTYTVEVFDDKNQSAGELTPQIRGGKMLEEIPFVVVGPRDLALEPEAPPLLGVAQTALAIYRLDADYRHQLFNSGQETLFILGETENIPRVVGAGTVIGLPAGADAKYVGPTGNGMAAHRIAIVDERQNAVAAGVKLFDTQAKAESGEALRLRAAAQTATLTTIALASAAALEKSLRYAAQFIGQDPTEIVVKPNLAFVDTKMLPSEAVQLMNLWQGGAISKTTLYDNLQRGEIASAERTFEEEQELIEQEAIDNPQAALGQGSGMGNGVTPPAAPNRFLETGEGLTIERA